MDDCSTDKTSDIIQKLAAKDSKIRVIHNIVNQKYDGKIIGEVTEEQCRIVFGRVYSKLFVEKEKRCREGKDSK